MAHNISKHVDTRDGSPQHLQVYQAKRDPTIDCITIVFTHASDFMRSKDWLGRVYYVGSCTTGNAFYQHGEAMRHCFRPGGSRIKWTDIAPELRVKIIAEYEGLWGIRFIRTDDDPFHCVDWEVDNAGDNHCADNGDSG